MVYLYLLNYVANVSGVMSNSTYLVLFIVNVMNCQLLLITWYSVFCLVLTLLPINISRKFKFAVSVLNLLFSVLNLPIFKYKDKKRENQVTFALFEFAAFSNLLCLNWVGITVYPFLRFWFRCLCIQIRNGYICFWKERCLKKIKKRQH